MKSSKNTGSSIQLVGFEEANSFSISDDVSINIRELIDLRDKLLEKMRAIRADLMGMGYSKEDLLKSGGYGSNVYVIRGLTSMMDRLGITDPKKIRVGMRAVFKAREPELLIQDVSKKFSEIVFFVIDKKQASNHMGDAFNGASPELIVSQATPEMLKTEIDENFLDCLKKMAEVTENIKELYGLDFEAMEAEVQQAIDTSSK